MGESNISTICTDKNMAAVIPFDVTVLRDKMKNDLSTRIRFWQEVVTRVIVLKPETFPKFRECNFAQVHYFLSHVRDEKHGSSVTV